MATNWDTVLADCDAAAAAIISEERPLQITFEGRTVTPLHIEHVERIRNYAEQRQARETDGGDSSSQAEFDG